MTRILLRAHKDPFHVATPDESLRANLVGDNSGNLIFSHASYKLLDTRRTEVVTALVQTGREDVARINAEYDAVVLPLANAFRISFSAALERLAILIEQLRVPVVILGVGAQLTPKGSAERLEPMRPIVERFVSAVLERSPSIGVRGEFTHDYLTGLGFPEDRVDVIGCPSLFMYGPDLRVDKRVPSLTRESDICINVSPYVKSVAPFVRHQVEHYPNLRYIAQDQNTLRLLLGRSPRSIPEDTNLDLPTYFDHPLIANRRGRFFTDTAPWLTYLRDFDFAVGTRIHGNIAALLAGTPSYVLTHDSRTLELARYFDIPNRPVRKVDGDTDAAELYDEADYTAFNEGHRARFETFTAFLDRHGLDHVFAPGEDPQAFEQRVADTSFPAGVTRVSSARRLHRRGTIVARRRMRAVIGRDRDAEVEPADPPAGATDELAQQFG